MELIRGIPNIRGRHRGCVLTIGNFDGVHRGHQAVLGQLAAAGNELGLATVLVTFEPQPQEFFAGSNAPARLTTFREKMSALAQTKVDRVVVLRFNRQLATVSANDFIEDFLVERLGAKLIIAGADFRFGRDAFGNLSLLGEYGKRLGFDVVQRATFNASGGRVSSSWIRDAIANGELLLARELLGRAYSMSGRVVAGKRLGREIGYPTANIEPRRLVCPLNGIYVVTLQVTDGPPLPGVASVGTRPTVNGAGVLLEVHIFDFDRDIYGRRVKVCFLKKLRDEQRFESVEVMRTQIDRDAELARLYFETNGSTA